MNVSEQEFNFMVEGVTSDLVQLMMDRRGCSLPEAIDAVYKSSIYAALLRPASGLYSQSSGYVYSPREISDIFLRFWFRYIEKNESMIEIGQYPLLAKVMTDDYATYSGDTLERYFRAKFAESLEYHAIGNWWDTKGYTDSKGNHQQGEIDIVAVSADDKSVDIIEVKRNPDKYDAALLKEKTGFFARKESRLGRYRKVLRCLSLEDM